MKCSGSDKASSVAETRTRASQLFKQQVHEEDGLHNQASLKDIQDYVPARRICLC